MTTRLGVGGTLAALPVPVAVLAAEAGLVWLTISSGVLTALILLATIADRLPVLHRLPLVGAPRLTVVFSIGDDESLAVSIEPNAKRKAVVLRVGVRNDRRANIADAGVNLLVPENVTLSRSDPDGNATRAGTVMFTSESLATEAAASERSRYWADKGCRFSGRSSELLHFRLELPGEGLYPIRFKVSAEPLDSEHKQGGLIRVVATDPPPPRGGAQEARTTSSARRRQLTRESRSSPPRRPAPATPSAQAPPRSESLEDEIRKEIDFGEQLRRALDGQGGGALRRDIVAWEERVAYMFERHDKDDLRYDFLRARPPRAESLPESLNLVQVVLRSLASPDLVGRVDAKLARLSKIAREL